MTLMGPAVIGLITTITLMFALRPLAVARGFIDSPGERKSHIGDVPVIGGIAMFVGMAAGFAMVPDAVSVHLFMLLAGGILLGIGMLDDRYRVSVYVRLGAQAVAVSVMVFGGHLVITDIGDPLGIGTLQLGAAATIFTALVAIAVINAFNFIDGIDGLAGCLAAIAIGAVGIVAADLTMPITTHAIIACSSIVGFLVFNFPVYLNRRLRSFMGDAGSTLLGLIVVWLTISVSQGETRPISPVIGLWIVLVPLADLFTCFVRRIAKGKSPFRPGREHLHYILLRGGLSVPQVLGLLIVLGGFYAAMGLIGRSLAIPDVVMFGAWVVVMVSQYPLMMKIALWSRCAHWKRLREHRSVPGPARLLAAPPNMQRHQIDQAADAR